MQLGDVDPVGRYMAGNVGRSGGRAAFREVGEFRQAIADGRPSGLLGEERGGVPVDDR
jgi:hypothetical protein